MDIPKNVNTAIDYAARDVARAIVDEHNCNSQFSFILRNIAGMLRAAATGSILNQIRREEVWTDPKAKGWLSVSAEVGPGGLDKDALTAAVQDWWSELDESKKFQVIMSSHPDTQFMNEMVQKLANKTEGDVAKTDARLLEIYRSKSPAAAPKQPAAPAPAGKDLPPEPEKAPDAQHPMEPQTPDPGQQAQPAVPGK